MATQGPTFPTVGADSAAGSGLQVWSNPGRITADDGSFASATNLRTTAAQNSHLLQGTAFGFSIPGGAIINGILLEIKRSCTVGAAPCKDSEVRLMKAGIVQTPDKSSATNWTTTTAYFSYGSAADLWSGTWTPTDINDTNFGASLRVKGAGIKLGTTAQVDAYRITVTYTTAGGVTQSQTSVVQAVNRASTY